jgi:Uma2 family endonuclease
MGAIDDVIDAPLSAEALGARFRELCDDPRFANLPGKIELDVWGRIVISPASNLHGMLQIRLGQRLGPLGGQAFAEASVVTPSGVLVADVAWGSADFLRAHRAETPFSRAPEICIEVVSPSNARKELEEKIAAYLAAGAVEVWIVLPKSQRVEVFGAGGVLGGTAYAVDLAGLFDC